jgi:hypothetical protein
MSVCGCDRDYATVPLVLVEAPCERPKTTLDLFAADVAAAVEALGSRLSTLEQQALEGRLAGETYAETATRIGAIRRTVDCAYHRAICKVREFAEDLAA